MDGLDSATWQALGLVLTVAGLVVSALVWTRRGPASGLRGVAWSLLPLAAGLTGVLKLGWEITDSVVTWATRLVFSPVVWLGLVVAGVSATLFVVSGMMRRRGAGGAGGRRAVAPGGARSAGAAQLPRSRSSRAATPPAAGSAAGGSAAGGSAAGGSAAGGSTTGGSTAGDDMDEIEAILRRHGIQ